MMLLSLDKQYTFYKSYHQNRKNRIIHVISLPVLIFTALVVLSYLLLPAPVSLNGGLVISVLYSAYVFLLDVYVGLAFLPYVALLYYAANLVSTKFVFQSAAPVAIAFHILGWIAQFLGHFKYEANSPALFTSLVHAVFAAPLVTYLELLFSMGLMESTRRRLRNAGVVRKVKNAQKANSAKN